MIPLGAGTRTPTFPFITYALVIANVASSCKNSLRRIPTRSLMRTRLIPYDLTHGIVLAPPSPPIPALTIFTAMFLHGSFLHIFFNMLFLVVFGPAMEYHVRLVRLSRLLSAVRDHRQRCASRDRPGQSRSRNRRLGCDRRNPRRLHRYVSDKPGRNHRPDRLLSALFTPPGDRRDRPLGGRAIRARLGCDHASGDSASRAAGRPISRTLAASRPASFCCRFSEERARHTPKIRLTHGKPREEEANRDFGSGRAGRRCSAGAWPPSAT